MKAEQLVVVEFECPMCEKPHYLRVPVSKLERFYNRRETGELIQDIFPDMSRQDREKFITGYCDDCQKLIFGE